MRMRYPFQNMSELIKKVQELVPPEEVTRSEPLIDVIYEIGHDRLQLEELLEQRRVQGNCPMGCGKTLYLAAKGKVECANPACDEHDAVSTLLMDAESEHLVAFAGASWSAKHPLRERLGNALLTCKVHEAVDIMLARPVEDGLYRVSPSPIGPGGWGWERLD